MPNRLDQLIATLRPQSGRRRSKETREDIPLLLKAVKASSWTQGRIAALINWPQCYLSSVIHGRTPASRERVALLLELLEEIENIPSSDSQNVNLT
jgi:hypothetical protein